MSILDSSLSRGDGGAPAGLQRFAAEVGAVLDALLHPARILAEVEQMGALLSAANRLHVADPARAGELRRHAARIGIR